MRIAGQDVDPGLAGTAGAALAAQAAAVGQHFDENHAAQTVLAAIRDNRDAALANPALRELADQQQAIAQHQARLAELQGRPLRDLTREERAELQRLGRGIEAAQVALTGAAQDIVREQVAAGASPATVAAAITTGLAAANTPAAASPEPTTPAPAPAAPAPTALAVAAATAAPDFSALCAQAGVSFPPGTNCAVAAENGPPRQVAGAGESRGGMAVGA
jgi:hypothetical protein